MTERVLLLGASSPVGFRVSQLFTERGFAVSAVSRHEMDCSRNPEINWLRRDLSRLEDHLDVRPYNLIISIAPIDLTASAVIRWGSDPSQRFVGLSSTSVLTKVHSHEESDRGLAQRLHDGERTIMRHFQRPIILRPTMIYFGLGDRNVERIVKHLRRISLFPLVGGGIGLRQPVHADDVANAVVATGLRETLPRSTYDIGGGEVLSVRDMVRRIASANGLHVSFVSIPLSVARTGLAAASIFPRYRGMPHGVLERMTQDLVFNNDAAQEDFEFSPRRFEPNNYHA